jgi:acetyltransferase-like isoleucine patch superfamily enzyme
MYLQGDMRINISPKLVIEDDVWLTHNSGVTEKVTFIHRGTILANGAILTTNTTCADGIWAGIPARLIKLRPEPVFSIPEEIISPSKDDLPQEEGGDITIN